MYTEGEENCQILEFRGIKNAKASFRQEKKMKAQSSDNKRIYAFFNVPNQQRFQDSDRVVCRVTICRGQAKTCLRSETEMILT